MDETLRFHLNGRPVRLEASGDRSLLHVLRTDLGLTGPKYGCGEGLCGACTVLIDGEAFRACVTSVADASGKRVTTIEGVSRDGTLQPLQSAFMKHNALQCGFCTPGMILAALDLLRRNPDPSRDEIVQALDINLCRCGAHVRIIEAVRETARLMRGGGLE